MLPTFASRAIVLLGTLGSVACGQVTGLSDDYTYDLGADGGTSSGDAGADAATASDARAPDAAVACSGPEKTRASAAIAAANGANLANPCKNCLAGSCCTQIDACTKTDGCARAMKCTFDCQTKTGTARTECLRSCDDTFTQLVGACVATECKTCGL